MVCVLVARDRNKNTSDGILKRFNCQEINDQISSTLHRDILMCTDSKAAYLKYGELKNIRHGKVHLSKGVREVKDIVHLYNVNSYHRRLKSWMVRFRGVATKYLDSYLSWFRELDEFNMQITDLELLLRAKTIRNYYHQP